MLVIDDSVVNSEEKNESLDHARLLMQMAGQVSSFKQICDPVRWQQQQRDEWKREWDIHER